MQKRETANVLSSRPLLESRSVSPLTFSVVINTDNRIDYLKRTLSGLKYLDYPHFEVCVVSGPTEDGTKALLSAMGDAIKVADCPVRNLSVSRNMGIAMAAGDVVVFIDDDSVPEAEWLTDLAAGYSDQTVGAVGGFVYDNTGLDFQAKYVTTNRLGYAANWQVPAPHLNFPHSVDFPHLLGTNCSFRRSALLEIGGFDEEYEYFLDETDVCCRINDAGYDIVQLDRAFVHHKFAPSHMRDIKRIIRSWYPLVKNRVYFGMRNGLNHHTVAQVVGAGIADIQTWERNVLAAASSGIHSPDEVERFYVETDAALSDGFTRGLQPAKLLSKQVVLNLQSPFQAYPLTRCPSDRRVFCFVTQDYPPGQNGGIARYMSQLARSLAALGHHVHVLTKATSTPAVDYEDGVWVYRIQIRDFAMPEVSPIAPLKIPHNIWCYSQTMLEEVIAINKRRRVDVVYCPLWDCEPISFVLDRRFRLIVALQTTMSFWLDSQKEKAADKDWMRLFGDPIMAMEKIILQQAPMKHAISRAILRDIEQRYDFRLSPEQVYCSPLGLEDWSAQTPDPITSKGRENCVRVLFVGRLESRKGIDVLLAAAPSLLTRFPNAILDIVGNDTIVRSDGRTYKEEFLEIGLPPSVANRVVFHGRVEEEELRMFYRDCDIFVAPSRYESFGLVFLEAMMFGKPVIGCDAGGGPEVVTDGETGFLIAPGDVKGLGKAMRTLVESKALRKRMGDAARVDYETRFSEAVMVRALLEVVGNTPLEAA